MLKHRIKYTRELEQDLFENARNHVIPISVIQNKIDELKKAIEEEDYEKLEYPIVEADIVIGVLQELLDLKE